MAYQPKERAFGPAVKACREAARSASGAFWRKQYGDPTDMMNALYRRGVTVDRKTASRWFYGESVPGTERLVELTAAGIPDAARVIFEPALLVGDKHTRRKRIAEKRAEAERVDRELRDMEEMERASRGRTGVAR